MTTTVTKSIGSAGGRDYATPQLWEDALPANLVSGDTVQIGECYNDSEFAGSGLRLQINGQTTDATHTITLRCAAGQSFRDHASVQTNALRYNASNGVGIRKTGGYQECIIVNTSFVYLDGLQIKEESARPCLSGPAAGVPVLWVSNCIFQGSVNGGGNSLVTAEGCDFWDNVFIVDSDGSSPGRSAIFHGYANGVSTFTNNTFVRPSNWTPGGPAISSTGPGGVTNAMVYKNNAFFGFTSIAVYPGRVSGNNNATDLSSVGFGTSNQVSLTYASQFEDPGTTKDFRAKAGGGLIDNGATLTVASPDIARTVRPSGSAYDIGAWELSAGLSPIVGTLTQTLADATIVATGTLPIVGALAKTLAPATLVATGALPIVGTLAATLAPATLIATGESTNQGTLAQTLENASLVATGALAIAGELSVTLEDAIRH